MNILVIVAHPDDEVLGAGGIMAKLAQENNVYTLILGEGVTSRELSSEEKKNKLHELKKQAEKANEILGVKEVFLENFPDNKFDNIPLLDIIKAVEKVIKKIKPKIVLTHHYGDLNVDHQITSKAVMTATRPIGVNKVAKIMSFEVLSSTEWNSNQKTAFMPNIYEDISKVLEKKIKAMEAYADEIRKYPHPRSAEGIRILAQKRGLEVGLESAEAFFLVREIL